MRPTGLSNAIYCSSAVLVLLVTTLHGQLGAPSPGTGADASATAVGQKRDTTGGTSTPQCLPAAVQRFDEPAPGARSPRNANYNIDVRLDHARRMLRGRETIRWRNISRASTSELQFHLYWNAWRDRDSTWLRERRLTGAVMAPRADAWGSIDVEAIRVWQPEGTAVDLTSSIRFIAPDDGNSRDRTVMAVALPFTVQPNETVQIDLEWQARIPRPFARTGYIDDYYFIAQWFPKLGVLEDGGWNTHQFHATTEFYADFGVYDVRLTVPRGFVIGASGREMGRTDNPDGTTTFRYRGEDIHDFAWTASPHFVELQRTFEHAALPRVDIRLLLQPEHRGQENRYFDATAAALSYFGEWFGPYPYDHLTIVDPAYQSGSDGMEYPTLFTGRTRWLQPEQSASLESVAIHETGHQFWYGVVASNEFEHAWLDEGLTTFATARLIEEMARAGASHPAYRENALVPRYFGGFLPWVVPGIRLSRATDGNRLPSYRTAAEADELSTPTWRYWPGTAVAITYGKTALWLHTLERHLGWPVLQRILATYYERWKFRHPTPAAFVEIASEVMGQDLTWFFDQVYCSSNTFDYGMQELVSERLEPDGPYRTVVVARRFGEAVFPVDVVTTFEDGHRVVERWDGRSRRATYVYERPSRARLAQVDPQRVLLLDVNYTNNSLTLAPRAAEAATRWTLTWLVWLQDLMLTYASFV
jgi:hypothetical protein